MHKSSNSKYYDVCKLKKKYKYIKTGYKKWPKVIVYRSIKYNFSQKRTQICFDTSVKMTLLAI